MEKKNKDISKKVMEQIEKEKIKMRPKVFFILGSIILGTGLAFVFSLSTVFINLVIFRLKVHAPFDYLHFGKAGLRPFYSVLPIFPLLLAILFIILGSVLIKKYDISYKKSYIGLIVGLVTFILVSGLLIEKIGVNEKLGQIRQIKPFVFGEYVGKEWVAGKITEIDKNIYTLETPLNKSIKVEINENTQTPKELNLQVNQEIRVIGKWEGDVFYATGLLPKPGYRNGKMNIKGVKIQKRYLLR